MNKQSVGPLVGGFFIGGVVTLITVFASGWAVTNSSAQEMAQEMAEEAVTERLAEIALIEARDNPQFEEKVDALRELSSWEQEDFVVEQGWATLPGREEPNTAVAEEIAEQLSEEG